MPDDACRRYGAAALLAVAVAARLILLADKSLWIDECLAWGAVRMGWTDMFRAVITGTPHPPLAFALMKLSTLFAGQGEFGLRLPAALITASAVIPVYLMASRRTSLQGGFFAGLLWALSPYAVSLGQEAWVYGFHAAFSFWFAWASDLAWRGHRNGFFWAVIFGLCGFLTQHIFALTAMICSLLYFTVPREERCSRGRFLLLNGILLSFFLPVVSLFGPQFAERSARMASAGFSAGFGRVFTYPFFTAMLQLVPGGILRDIEPGFLHMRKQTVLAACSGGLILYLSGRPLLGGRLSPSSKAAFAAALMLPFALFLVDGPTARHLVAFWIPFSLLSAMVFARSRLAGVLTGALCLSMLFPYWSTGTFPYHRSDWRGAIALVESLSEPGDAVVVLGGKSTSLAWQFYSRSGMEYYAPSGDSPFAGDMERATVDPARFIAGLGGEPGGKRVWVILDVWGVPSIHAVVEDFTLVFWERVSERMDVGLLVIDEYL